MRNALLPAWGACTLWLMEDQDSVPSWANFFSAPAYRAFVASVERELIRRGIPYEMGDGIVRLYNPHGELHTCGLGNLAQMCNQTELKRWEGLIHHHFEVMFTAYLQNHDRFGRNFDEVRSLLKARLYPSEYLSQLPHTGLVYRPVAEGLIQVLTYDLPTHIVTVARKHPDSWGVSEDELFALAADNLRSDEAPDHQIQVLDGGASLYTLVGNSYFTASHTLILGDYLEPGAEHGAVCVAPHRHIVLYHPLRELETSMQAIMTMIPVALGMYRDGPGSISPQLYWWKNGTLTLLPIVNSGEDAQFLPPQAFVEQVLGRLAAVRQPN